MTKLQKAAAGFLILAFAAVMLAWFQTAPTRAVPKKKSPVPAAELVDQSSLATAQRLQSLVTAGDELPYAQSALRLADHELALAFTSALRDVEAHPPQLGAEARQIEDRREKSQALLADDEQRVARLTAAVAAAPPTQKDSLQDELELAQSQLDLDKDELEEANQDLVEAGGNLQQRIEAMVQEHEAQVHARPVAAAPTATAPTAPTGGLLRKFRQWLALEQTQRQLANAEAQAAANQASLAARRQGLAAALENDKGGIAELQSHTKLAKASGAPPPPSAPATHSHEDARTLLSQTKQIGADQKVLTLLDRRIDDHRQLAAAYQAWQAIVAAQARAILHAMLLGLAVLIAVLLGLVFLDRWLRHALDRPNVDRRQLETLRTIGRVGLRVVGVLAALLIVVGMPGQLGTMIGIVGAGLTVALKDFIVAFFGWLVLMGKNGIRLGDWVEINGVSGEVIELGMFHTVLLETGNWSDAGHPTGRRVTFTNSFAIEGHYFNFSTSGQWLWDELQIVVPAGQDPYPIVAGINNQVTTATAESARLAEQEWQRAVPGRKGGMFSGTPGINVKPVVGGVEISVRYITRANERFQLRASLYQSAVDLLAKATAHAA